MALTGEMRKGKLFLLFFASVFFVAVCDGTKEKKLQHLIKDFKGESDKLANEIYSWIDKRSKGLESHDYARHQARDHLKSPELINIPKKSNVEEVIKTLKGESDHLANEIYSWIDKRKKGFLSRDHLRSRRSIMKRSSDEGNVVEGSKEHKLKHLIKDFKGESDKLANEIYSWIDKRSKVIQSHDYVRHQSRDHLKGPGLSEQKKPNVQEVIKTLKGESDHLASEIYAWIDKHKKGFLSRDHLRSRRSIMKRSSDEGNVVEGTKEKKLQHLIKDFKGESDKLANEIYSWIDKHSKGLQSHDHVRHQSRDHSKISGLSKRHKKGNVKKVIKTLKSESDHLASEIYAWIDKRKKGFSSRGHGHARDHLRSRRSIMRRSSDDGNVVEGESIQDVMLDLMNAPHSKNKRHASKKTKKSLKRKVTKRAKHAATKKSSKKGNKKSRIQKHVRPVSHSKKSKIPKNKKSSSAHVIKAVKKSGGLADLLKVISADPSKKIVVTKGKNDVTLDAKSLKFFSHIPKPVLQRLLENIELNKYFNIDTYISGEKGKKKAQKTDKNGKKSKVGKTNRKIVAKKKILRKVVKKNLQKLNGKLKADEKGSGSAMESSAEEEKENKLKMKVKKLSKKAVKKSSLRRKKAKIANKGTKNIKLRKAKKKEEHADSKSNVFQHNKSKKSKEIWNDKKKHIKRRETAKIGHQKLAELKDKIKKTNSLKFKVAKALLEHCETQNKLKKVFDNVNASLKEASQLAKVIGKKFGIKKADLDKLTTKHTEEAVQEFLNKIF